MSVPGIYSGVVNERRPTWRIVRAIHAELRRQEREGMIINLTTLDESGHASVAGSVDLAALAHATELALRGEFFG